MFTHKFFINKSGKISLRLRNNNRKTELCLDHSATQDELDEGLLYAQGIRRGNCRLKSHLKLYILKIKQVEDVLIGEERKDEDVMVIRSMLEKALGLKREEDSEKGSFVSHYQTFMNGKTNRGTKSVYKHTLDRIRLFDPTIDRKPFEDIDLKWLTEFEAFCAKTACKNARNIHLRNIRAVFNNAIDYEITTVYPFRRFKIRPEETRKRSLPVEELRKVFDYPVEPYAEIYRDCFKLIFMLVGINCVDLWGLKAITTEGRIEYKRAKTGRLYSIKVEPEALEIIEKHRGEKGLLTVADRWGDHRNFCRQCDKALRSIGAVKNKGGRGHKTKKQPQGLWPELTTYWARHTWATIAADLDIPDAVISFALGHAGQNATTEIYIRRNLKKLDRANRMVLDYVLYGKKSAWTM